MMAWSERGNIQKRDPNGNASTRTQLLQLTGEPVMVQRKKKPSGSQWKCLRKTERRTITVRDLLRFLTSSRRFS